MAGTNPEIHQPRQEKSKRVAADGMGPPLKSISSEVELASRRWLMEVANPQIHQPQ